jgi:hypothetical protein
MNRDFDFDFSKLKNRRDLKRIYNAEIWNWFNKNKDCVFTVITENDSSHHLYRHIESFFIKHSLKGAYISKDKGVLYVETYNPRCAITEKYIVVNKRLRLDNI